MMYTIMFRATEPALAQKQPRTAVFSTKLQMIYIKRMNDTLNEQLNVIAAWVSYEQANRWRQLLNNNKIHQKLKHVRDE